jgi:anti-sigma-K factor RskA
MIDERQEELAALAALDLLEGAERAEFEAALARNPELARHVADLREACAALAHTCPAAQPPAGLKARVLQSCPVRAAAAKAPARILPFPSLLAWAVAAGLAVAAAWSGQLYWTARTENDLLRDQQKLADLALQGARNQLNEERIVNQRELADIRQQVTDTNRALVDATQRAGDSARQMAVLAGQLKVASNLMRLKIVALSPTPSNTAKAVAVALWDAAKQEGMLDISKLPPLAAGQDYQLWALDPQYSAPVSSGVFQVDPVTCTACVTFKTAKPIKSGVRFAVSLERKGGDITPHGPILLLSD